MERSRVSVRGLSLLLASPVQPVKVCPASALADRVTFFCAVIERGHLHGTADCRRDQQRISARQPEALDWIFLAIQKKITLLRGHIQRRQQVLLAVQPHQLRQVFQPSSAVSWFFWHISVFSAVGFFSPSSFGSRLLGQASVVSFVNVPRPFSSSSWLSPQCRASRSGRPDTSNVPVKPLLAKFNRQIRRLLLSVDQSTLPAQLGDTTVPSAGSVFLPTQLGMGFDDIVDGGNVGRVVKRRKHRRDGQGAGGQPEGYRVFFRTR